MVLHIRNDYPTITPVAHIHIIQRMVSCISRQDWYLGVIFTMENLGNSTFQHAGLRLSTMDDYDTNGGAGCEEGENRAKLRRII
jgi:hypothetical protein